MPPSVRAASFSLVSTVSDPRHSAACAARHGACGCVCRVQGCVQRVQGCVHGGVGRRRAVWGGRRAVWDGRRAVRGAGGFAPDLLAHGGRGCGEEGDHGGDCPRRDGLLEPRLRHHHAAQGGEGRGLQSLDLAGCRDHELLDAARRDEGGAAWDVPAQLGHGGEAVAPHRLLLLRLAVAQLEQQRDGRVRLEKLSPPVRLPCESRQGTGCQLAHLVRAKVKARAVVKARVRTRARLRGSRAAPRCPGRARP